MKSLFASIGMLVISLPLATASLAESKCPAGIPNCDLQTVQDKAPGDAMKKMPGASDATDKAKAAQDKMKPDADDATKGMRDQMDEAKKKAPDAAQDGAKKMMDDGMKKAQ